MRVGYDDTNGISPKLACRSKLSAISHTFRSLMASFDHLASMMDRHRRRHKAGRCEALLCGDTLPASEAEGRTGSPEKCDT